jgi:hypothetical protein
MREALYVMLYSEWAMLEYACCIMNYYTYHRLLSMCMISFLIQISRRCTEVGVSIQGKVLNKPGASSLPCKHFSTVKQGGRGKRSSCASF